MASPRSIVIVFLRRRGFSRLRTNQSIWRRFRLRNSTYSGIGYPWRNCMILFTPIPTPRVITQSQRLVTHSHRKNTASVGKGYFCSSWVICHLSTSRLNSRISLSSNILKMHSRAPSRAEKWRKSCLRFDGAPDKSNTAQKVVNT